MPLRRFASYEDADGIAWGQNWFSSQPDGVRATIRADAMLFESRPKWPKRYYQRLKRDEAGLSEFRAWRKRLHGGTAQTFRLYGPTQFYDGRFVVLTGCEKLMNGITEPPDALALAIRLKEQLEQGKGRVRDFNFD